MRSVPALLLPERAKRGRFAYICQPPSHSATSAFCLLPSDFCLTFAIVEEVASYRREGWFPCREPATRRIECIELMLDPRMIFLRNSACRVAFKFGDSAKKLHPMSNAWDVPDHHHLMKMCAPIKLVLIRGLAALFMIAIPAWAGTQEESKVVEQPPVKTTEPWEINVGGPGWLASVSGHSGFHGHNPYIDVGVGQILKNINVIGAFTGEVRKGRFGLNGGFLYLNAQAGTGERSGLVSKVDLGLQQYIGQLFGSYRLIKGPCGWLDLLAGFRFTYLGEQVGLQANNMAIDAASTQLVDRFAQQAATPGSDVRTLIAQNITDRLGALDGHHPKIPVAPVAEGQKGVIANLVLQLLQSQQGELADAIRAGAQARVNQLKAQLSTRVANSITHQLNRSFSFYDSWTDPAMGLRGRLNLSKAFYLTAETDVGGFGIGSDIAVEAYAALGCQITRYIYSEIGYRYYYDDFRDESANDFLYQMTLQGAQLTVGLTF